MSPQQLRKLLDDVRTGVTTIDEALRKLQSLHNEDLGFAVLDHHRTIRCGFPEVIFGQGKSPEQMLAIFERLAESGVNVLATRVHLEAVDLVQRAFPHVTYHPAARTLSLRQRDPVPAVGHIALVAAGTSDLPVAEEARITAELMDQRVETHYDVGVAGLHRLLERVDTLRTATALVVVAGMEGALPSVVGGLVSAPVIAVPTSVGYGANFQGLAALLGMLNSCAAGVSVVNIDNGFAAGYQAALICRQVAEKDPQ